MTAPRPPYSVSVLRRSSTPSRILFNCHIFTDLVIDTSSTSTRLFNMAANARYEQAPQRDSFEEREFSQPPPSYQATPEFPSAPRSEGDNLPDDFKVCTLVYRKKWGCFGIRDVLTEVVRWYRRGGDPSHPYAVRPEGVFDLVSTAQDYEQDTNGGRKKKGG